MSTQQLTSAEVRIAADRLPRYRLAHLPTPLEPLDRFSAVLGGPRIFIKRDDCTGFALGGNKTRHNEFLMGDALAHGADIVVWGAGVQSNNCRQTAAACAKAGLPIHLILGRGGPSETPEPIQGNLLLDYLVGAHVEIVDEPLGPQLEARITAQANAYREAGRKVYNWDRKLRARAAVSYAICLAEIVEQTEALQISPSACYVSSGGSTGGGLILGKVLLGTPYPIINVAPIQWPYDVRADLAKMANDTAALMELETDVQRVDVELTNDYIAPGYGLVSPGCLEAIALLARTEGILLDPIYTGKALAALIADVRQGRFQKDDSLVFIHTGGTPALFAYHEELTTGIAPRRLV